MEILHIDAKSNVDINNIVKKIKFKGKLGLLTTIQLVHKLKDIKEKLPNSIIGGQVMGCDVSLAKKIQNKVDGFLYIGSGEFHPLQIALETGKEVLWANPYTNQISKISKNEIEKRKKRIKGAYLKYLHAEKIGILVSTKNGQNQLKKAMAFKKKANKETYIFLFNTLNFNELENFPEIDCWINTACLRIALEDYDKFNKPIINLRDIESKTF
ncbi:MAG: diphthamide synthesis protein [Nanoarchaeota archaeon]|nr:diphthamide synthesis protein [Nanoarchaeota archaeon]